MNPDDTKLYWIAAAWVILLIVCAPLAWIILIGAGMLEAWGDKDKRPN